MLNNSKISHVRVYRNVLVHIKQYLLEESRVRLSLMWLTWPLALVLISCLASLIYFARPFPPSTVRMAVGQKNSSLHILGTRYASYFKANGVDLILVNTAGAADNLDLLCKEKVDVALSVGGINSDRNTGEIKTLGGVEYQPFWLFYRGDEYNEKNPEDFFKKKRLSINLPGSGTRHLSESILNLYDIDIKNNPMLVEMASDKSAQAVIDGRLDGMFLNAGLESSAIQKLLKEESLDIKIFNFSAADAYTKHLTYLRSLTLPFSALDVRRAIPSRQIQMVATTTTILVDKDLHPAIQQLFLTVSKKINASAVNVFDQPGGFPANTERDFPLSSVAERYYTKGPPALEGSVPYWVASLFDQVWFISLAVVAFVLPLLKFVPNYRGIYASVHAANCAEEIDAINKRLNKSTDNQVPADVIELLDAMERGVNASWIPSSHKSEFSKIQEAIHEIRERVSQQDAQDTKEPEEISD